MARNTGEPKRATRPSHRSANDRPTEAKRGRKKRRRERGKREGRGAAGGRGGRRERQKSEEGRRIKQRDQESSSLERARNVLVNRGEKKAHEKSARGHEENAYRAMQKPLVDTRRTGRHAPHWQDALLEGRFQAVQEWLRENTTAVKRIKKTAVKRVKKTAVKRVKKTAE
ncbi:hypothetical protein B0H14DRAFT_2594608 [Mycena olivaceomarginata]|nr:hypothetical protein B0H14DRAFT_2594608 [Mycena olivaceomarginata]